MWCVTSGGRATALPYELADEEVGHLLFPKTHPYYGNVIGSHADIEAARLNDVRDFFQHYYTPNNASIAIAGDFDRAKVKALVEKYFGPIPARAGGGEAGGGDSADRERAAGNSDGYSAAAAGFDGVADAGGVQARGCGCGFLHARAGWRENQPLVPQAGL